jgi:hypothetical protein
MRKYQRDELNYTHDALGAVMAVTEAEAVAAINPTSKKIYLINDGAKDVYVAFDKAVRAADPAILVKAGEALPHPLTVQAEEIHAICKAGETSTLRVIVCY